MAARTLGYRISLFSLLGEIRYTLSLLSAAPLAAPYVPIFKALNDEVKTLLLHEIGILEGLSDGQAAVDWADKGIDGFSGRVFHMVEDLAGGNPNHPLKVHLFRRKSLSKFRRPVLRSQLTAMTTWPSSFDESGNATLIALKLELDPLLTAAQQAVTKQGDAVKANRQFRDIGDRKQFIDKVNAARKQVHGELAKLPFQQLGLPSDFADQFFRTETRYEDEEEETVDTVKASITELEAELKSKKALLEKLEAEAAAEAQAAAEQLAQQNKAAELRAQAEEILRKAAEIEAQLTKK